LFWPAHDLGAQDGDFEFDNDFKFDQDLKFDKDVEFDLDLKFDQDFNFDKDSKLDKEFPISSWVALSNASFRSMCYHRISPGLVQFGAGTVGCSVDFFC